MKKVDSKKLLKRTSLLDTAFELFTTKGFSNTSVSEITSKAGIAKGTFYLYFKDKYDIRNKLIAHETSKLFRTAHVCLIREKKKNAQSGISSNCCEDMIFIADVILDIMNKNKNLLNLISKNLSWGLFKDAVANTIPDDENDFKQIYLDFLKNSGVEFDNPEIMLYQIVEYIGASAYSPILYNEPVGIEEFKPYMHRTIEAIINSHVVK